MSNYQDKKNNLDEENELQLIIGRNPVIEALKANKLIDLSILTLRLKAL